MPTLSEAEALAKLTGAGPITYNDLDDIFTAFAFESSTDGKAIWYYHERYPIGPFRSCPIYDLSTVLDAERNIVWRMIDQLRDFRDLEE
jgi:hypothetical protein